MNGWHNNCEKQHLGGKRVAKVKIKKIDFVGNKALKDESLRAAMKDTKQKKLLTLKASKFIKEKYQADLVKMIDAYKEKGYRDARIISDSVAYNPVPVSPAAVAGNEWKNQVVRQVVFSPIP